MNLHDRIAHASAVHQLDVKLFAAHLEGSEGVAADVLDGALAYREQEVARAGSGALTEVRSEPEFPSERAEQGCAIHLLIGRPLLDKVNLRRVERARGWSRA